VVLASFLIGLAVVVLGTAFAALRGFALWRQTKTSGRAIAWELSAFERKTWRSERHLAELERSNAELQRALEQLRSSRARLQVLLDSVEQASARVRWLRVFLPR
jgi:septal ring factor EnvC (AmiA/AmiB activator)